MFSKPTNDDLDALVAHGTSERMARFDRDGVGNARTLDRHDKRERLLRAAAAQVREGFELDDAIAFAVAAASGKYLRDLAIKNVPCAELDGRAQCDAIGGAPLPTIAL